MGSDQNFLTQVGSGQYFISQIGAGQPSLVWVWKISHINISNFSICFPSGQKISSVQVKKYLGQRRVGFLFTAGQEYAWVGSYV